MKLRLICKYLPLLLSHPTWVRGLKQVIYLFTLKINVAPYVGAWIETVANILSDIDNKVAPYVGAWIETL